MCTLSVNDIVRAALHCQTQKSLSSALISQTLCSFSAPLCPVKRRRPGKGSIVLPASSVCAEHTCKPAGIFPNWAVLGRGSKCLWQEWKGKFDHPTSRQYHCHRPACANFVLQWLAEHKQVSQRGGGVRSLKTTLYRRVVESIALRWQILLLYIKYKNKKKIKLKETSSWEGI